MVSSVIDFDEKKIYKKIITVLNESDIVSKKESKLIAIHMTDWVDNLKEICNMYSNIDEYSSKQILDMIIYFLSHVPNHLAAASKLLLDIPVSDIFEVGAVKK